MECGKKNLENVWYATYTFFVTRPTPRKKKLGNLRFFFKKKRRAMLFSLCDVHFFLYATYNKKKINLPKGFIKEALRIINADRSVQVPSTIPENGWEEEVTCWKLGESPPAPTSHSESPPPSTSYLLFDEEDPLSEPKGNIAASSSEPTVGEFPAFPASNSEDVPQDGKSMKGNAKDRPRSPLPLLTLPHK